MWCWGELRVGRRVLGAFSRGYYRPLRPPVLQGVEVDPTIGGLSELVGRWVRWLSWYAAGLRVGIWFFRAFSTGYHRPLSPPVLQCVVLDPMSRCADGAGVEVVSLAELTVRRVVSRDAIFSIFVNGILPPFTAPGA